MLENIQTGDDFLKQSTLQALGYVCEATVSLYRKKERDES
jgi:hypothetical protein